MQQCVSWPWNRLFHPDSRYIMTMRQNVSSWFIPIGHFLSQFHLAESTCFTSGNGHVSCWFNLFHHCITSGNGHVPCWFNLLHYCFTSVIGHVSCWLNLFHHCFTSVNGHVSCWFNLFHHCFTNVSCWFNVFHGISRPWNKLFHCWFILILSLFHLIDSNCFTTVSPVGTVMFHADSTCLTTI